MPKSTQTRKDVNCGDNIQCFIHPYIFSQYSEDVGTGLCIFTFTFRSLHIYSSLPGRWVGSGLCTAAYRWNSRSGTPPRSWGVRSVSTRSSSPFSRNFTPGSVSINHSMLERSQYSWPAYLRSTSILGLHTRGQLVFLACTLEVN